ncbi:MAG: hypothetical protein ACLS89_03485 [Collinsella sp.]
MGREKLVLGAWGCDNNGFDAEAVAELFREELASGDFKVKQVFFAVPSTRWDEDFAKFEHVLASFPERNEESYAQAAARAAAARAVEQAQAQPRTMRTRTTGASTCKRCARCDMPSRRELLPSAFY